jgi:hypothetical protein
MKVFSQFSNIKPRYMAFFGVVVVLSLTALISVPCPVCDGTGKISKAVGMENVRITNIESDQNYVNMEFCLGYILYKYTIHLTLSNSGNEQAAGWIKVVLRGRYKGAESLSNVFDVNYVGVEIPAKITVSDSFVVWFQTPYDVPVATSVDAMVEEGGVECLACEGSGSVRLNTWLVANGLKDSLEKVTRMEQEFKPPPWIEPEPPGGE